MAWRSSVVFPIIVLSSAMGAGANAVRADEAFLCGPDTVVYVKTEELEAKKRTDPCIAGYFGLQVEGAAKAQPVKTAPAKEAPHEAVTAPAEPVAAPAKKAKRPEAQKDERTADLRPSVPAAGTDFRNVRILNASASGAQWFRHDR